MSFNPETHYQDDKVAQRYDAERFSSIAGRLFQNIEQTALKRALRSIPHGSSILDVPCGTGRVAAPVSAWGYGVSCADISLEMIQVARNRLDLNGSGRFARASAEALPFPDGSFDVVMSMRFLPHFSTAQRREIFPELARVSRRWVLFSNSYTDGWYCTRRRVKKWLRHQAPTRFPVSERELGEELEAAKLREIARFWPLRYVSEEILVLCEKLQST